MSSNRITNVMPPPATEHKYDKTRIENWLPKGIELESSRLATNGHNNYIQLLLRKVIIFYIPIHKVLEKPRRHFTSLKLCKCYQIPHPSTRVSSNFCRWHMLRFDTSYKGGRPFVPILKLVGLNCAICCNWQLFFPDSVMFRDFLFLSVL